jgi:LytS/YehU family sensor histidine kinase
LDLTLSIPLHGASELLSRITTQYYLSNTFSKSFTLVTWSAIYFGITLWIEWNIQKERTERATLLAHSAQLQMLRYQLNPHFLFNALNSIRALIEEDKQKARNMITELSEFLRYSLISRKQDTIPLRHELEAIGHYLEIEKKRFEEKLEINFKIDPAADEFPILSFLIHPLVENAVKYGMQTSPLPLKILLSAQVSNGTLKLEVSNTGKWIDPSSQSLEKSEGTGTGLENVRLRLQNAFPDSHQLDIVEEKGQVRIILQIGKEEKV